MRSNVFVLTIIFCLLLSQVGCQQQAAAPMAPVKPEAKARPAVEEPVPAAPEKPEAAKPEPAKPEVLVEAEGPKITFENVVHNFGDIAPNTKNICEFKFTNTGKDVLKIGKIYASCGCTVPQLAKEEYAPGESGAVTVEFSSGLHAGQQSRRLDVPSNDKDNPKVALTVKALVIVKIEYEPKRLNLSLKNDPNSPNPKIKIRSLDGKPFAISGYKSTPEGMLIDFDPMVKKAEFVIEPKLDAEKLQKNLQGHLEINITYPGYNLIGIPFTVMPRFHVSPPAIVLLGAKPKDAMEREITIVNNYGESFEVESTSTERNLIKVIKQEKVGDRCKIKISITPPEAEDNPKMFTDRLIINIKNGEKLEVACKGFYPSEKEKR